MILHCNHAHETENLNIQIVVRSPDTDVLALLIFHSQEMQRQIILDTGSGNKMRLINTKDIIKNIGTKYSNTILESIHSLDAITPARLFVEENCSPRSCLKNVQNSCKMFSGLGMHPLTENTFKQLETFVCLLYGSSVLTDLNKLRYHIFRKHFDSSLGAPLQNYNGIDLSLILLPPCRSSM